MVFVILFWVLGIASMATGAAQWYPPAGWIVVGCGLVFSAAWPFVRERWF